MVLISQLRAVPESCGDQPGCAKKKKTSSYPAPAALTGISFDVVRLWEGLVLAVSLRPTKQRANYGFKRERLSDLQSPDQYISSCNTLTSLLSIFSFLINSSTLPGLFKNCPLCVTSSRAGGIVPCPIPTEPSCCLTVSNSVCFLCMPVASSSSNLTGWFL